MKLDKNDSTSIEKVIDLFADPGLELNLVYIKSNFGLLPNSIKGLESSKICLAECRCYTNCRRRKKLN